MEEKNKASVVIKYVVLTIFAITAIMPMVYMISSSFMGVNEVRDAIENYKFHIIPDCFTLVQYYDILLKKPDFLIKFWSSVILVAPIVVGQIVVSILGAYAFAKMEFPFKQYIFFYVHFINDNAISSNSCTNLYNNEKIKFSRVIFISNITRNIFDFWSFSDDTIFKIHTR